MLNVLRRVSGHGCPRTWVAWLSSGLVMFPDFPLDLIDWIFPGEALNPIFGDQDAGISEFLPHNSVVVFDAEQVY